MTLTKKVTRLKNFIVVMVALGLLIAACAKSPLGRRQLILMPEGQMATMGQSSFEEIKSSGQVLKKGRAVERVQCITKRIVKALDEGGDFSQWEVQVFKNESANAFALPGKKIGVHTGLLDIADNNAQVAAVIGHEVGHVIARHGNERVSQAVLTQTGLAVGDLLVGKELNPTTRQIVVAGLGVGLQFGVLLPFSRKHESEADLIGLQLMAKAGFDPSEAANLWVNMSKSSGDGPPEFLSTHPAPSSRIQSLRKKAPKYQEIYERARVQAKECPPPLKGG